MKKSMITLVLVMILIFSINIIDGQATQLIHLETVKKPRYPNINVYAFKHIKGKKLIVINTYEGHVISIIIDETTEDYKIFTEEK